MSASELSTPVVQSAPPRRRAVVAWAFYDWGSSSFNTVIISFVFSVYIVKGVVGDARPGGFSANTWLGLSGAVAGLFIALLAPVTGQRADAGGHRRRSLAIWSALVIASMLGLFTVKSDPQYLWIALVLLSAGAIFAEFAGVSYNAMLHQVSTPATIGRVSGFGWSMGYFGGIFLLLLCNFGLIVPGHFLPVSSAEGLNFRVIAVLSAVWFAIFALPVLFAVPETPAGPRQRRRGVKDSYVLLKNDIIALYRSDRNAVYFLLASALYRDGLAAIFSYGAILAVTVYGLGSAVGFGIAANVVAAIGALTLGRAEDRIGPKRVIMIALTGITVTAVILLFVHGPTMFWIFGLLLAAWVGPAQSSSRSFLARIAPVGREGEMFGLYATTGRAASLFAPALFALFSGLFSDRMGIVGIALVLGAGALAMTRVTSPPLPQAVTIK
ncbi:MAG: transporter [Friedmanniella sp.]|jgi:UMF1 family MFS transporter|nr:transporter [Friedmanniella sp.]